ncbi:MAG: YicC family protein [Bacteroidales bacterium]|nr:YicC family protein [Bacteroidales bacterium]
MIKSMTGYGKKSITFNNKKISVEIKSLNSKNLNLQVRIPESYNSKDLEIRNVLSEELKGGKISFTLNIDNHERNSLNLNKEKISLYYKELETIALKHNLKPENEQLLQAVLRLPDITENEAEEENPEEWKQIKNLIKETIKEIQKFRLQEGASAERDITENIQKIEQLIPEVEKYESERIETVKERLNSKLKEFIDSGNQNGDRFEQEIIYFLDKFDINEEKIRLKNHCTFFIETMQQNEVVGNKLGFIAQEIGREINTLGSKANHAEIQKIVVNMKDYLGKVKEQSLNIL